MAEIVATTQLSLFSIIKSVILSNSTLSARFNSNNILQYEPKHKSANFCGFPYLVIKVPTTSTDFVTLNHSTTDKEFNTEIFIVMEYLARDSFLSYVNQLIYQIELSESTFESSGYFNVKIDLRSIEPTTEDQKELIVGNLILSSTSLVNR